MSDRNDLRSPSRSPNMQRSQSFVGAKLHFKYTGNEKKIDRPEQESSHLRVPGQRPALPRQSTLDYSHQALSSDSPVRSSYDPYSVAKSRSQTESSVIYKVPNYYDQLFTASTSNQPSPSPRLSSHLTKDVTLATSSRPPQSQFTEGSATRNLPLQASYESTSISRPPNALSTVRQSEAPRPPSAEFLITREVSSNPYSKRPSPTLNAIPTTRDRFTPSTNTYSSFYTTPRYSTMDKPPIPAHYDQSQVRLVPTTQPVTAEKNTVSRQEISPVPSRNAYSSQPPPLLLRQSSTTTASTTPQSLNAHFEMKYPRGKSRNLTIGYSQESNYAIEEAQRRLREESKKNELELAQKLAQKKAAEAAARLEEARKIQEAAQLEEARKAQLAAKLEEARKAHEAARLESARKAQEAAQKAAEEARRRGSGEEEEEDVAKFIQNLEQRIKESQDSKNLIGALAGRQITQNHVQNVESLTNVLKNKTTETVELVEGHDSDSQATIQSVADSLEEYTFLEKIKNMKTDQNANRKKFAEHYYDIDDDDDSELNSSNSINSFLSTVTEEDADCASLNQILSRNNIPMETLPSCVIDYIHDLVDGIFSSIEKTVIIPDTQKILADDTFYTDESDSNYNYQIISEKAKQFFTPRPSTDEEKEPIKN